MKRLITILLLVLVATSVWGQVVGVGYYGQNGSLSGSDLYQKGQRNIRTGNTIFLVGIGVGATVGVVSVISGSATFLGYVVKGTELGLVAATPFWITGVVRKRRAKNMAYVPLLEFEIPLNDNLTLETSFGTAYGGNMPGIGNSMQPGPGVCFSLNF